MGGNYAGARPRLVPRDPEAVGEVVIDLPYAEDGIASYALFRRLRDEGVIAPGTQFQVSIPSAIATTLAFIDSEFTTRCCPGSRHPWPPRSHT